MMTRVHFLFDISDLPEHGFKSLHKMLAQHDAEQRAELERLDQLTTMQDGGIRSLHEQIVQKDVEIARLWEVLTVSRAAGSMIWTTRKPSQSGWYWMKIGLAVVCVEVEIGVVCGECVEWVWQVGREKATPLSKFPAMQWAGPIPEPVEGGLYDWCQHEAQRVKEGGE